jgi:hypothetical protein
MRASLRAELAAQDHIEIVGPEWKLLIGRFDDCPHEDPAQQHARDVLVMAAMGGMQDSAWATDSRIERACNTLGWTADEARAWARAEASAD